MYKNDYFKDVFPNKDQRWGLVMITITAVLWLAFYWLWQNFTGDKFDLER